jgi:hypothetical protein
MNENEIKYSKKVLKYIRQRLGRNNAIKVEDLMTLIPLNDREIRRVVQHLVNEGNHPIGSTTNSPYGFYMIVDVEDYLEAVRNLINRKTKLQERIESLRKACVNEGVSVPKVEISKSKGTQIFNISNSVVIYLK